MYLLTQISMLASTVITGGETAAPVVAAAETAGETAGNAGAMGFFGGDGITMLLIYAAVIGGMWFLMIRPQRKREKAMRELQQALKVGDDIVTSSGFFGRIVSVGDDNFVVEFGTSKSVRIPVRKTDVIGKQTPSIKE